MLDAEQFGRVGIVVAGPQAGAVGGHRGRVAAELLHQPLQHRLQRAVVQPEAQSQAQKVLAPRGVLARQLHAADGLLVQPGHGHGDDAECRQFIALQRIGGVLGFRQIGRRELILVDHDDAAGLNLREADLQSRRVHGDQNVGRIAGRVNLVVGEIELETAHPPQKPGRGADLGRVIRQRADNRSRYRGDVCELIAGQLHAVARIAREPHRRTVHLDELLVLRRFHLGHGCFSLLLSRQARSISLPRSSARENRGPVGVAGI